MIQIKFDPSKLKGQLRDEWDAWQLRADAATNEVIAAWEEWRENGSIGEFRCEFDDSIWGDLKAWLVKNVFHNKCAYCETREVRAPYHAEHFRPKGRVTIRTASKKQKTCTTVDEEGKEIKHPGYLLDRIQLENIGPFDSLELKLDPNWNILLGDNGSGALGRSQLTVRRAGKPIANQPSASKGRRTSPRTASGPRRR